MAYRVDGVTDQNCLPCCPTQGSSGEIYIPVGWRVNHLQSSFDNGMEALVLIQEYLTGLFWD